MYINVQLVQGGANIMLVDIRAHVRVHQVYHSIFQSPLCTMVRNVRQAHECLESGENQQFFDEMEYLMDSIQPSQPLAVRCLG